MTIRTALWDKPAKDPLLERLRRLAPFATCSDRELEAVSRRVYAHHAKAQAVLTRQGSTGYEFVVIAEGSASVLVGDRPVARLGPGDFFGEVALIDHGSRTATVIADTDLVAMVSSAREFDEILTIAPSVARALLRGMAGRLRAVDACSSAGVG